MSAVKYWIWLSELRGIGALSARRLLDRFQSPEAVYFASESDYRKAGLSAAEISKLQNKDMRKARGIAQLCFENDWTVLTYEDAAYPDRLRTINDPPLTLYVRGRLPVMDEEAAIAVVGTRSCTPYGLKTAERIGYEVTKAGGLIVTGLARGIDTAAAMGALRAGGRVIGVLGCGLDVVYPPENRQLIDDTAAAGAVITEFPPKTPAIGRNFPRRNRIMSGISVGCVVVEAPAKSGALITASCALEQGRDVFVVPGNVDSASCEGSNRLLREGGIPIMSGGDILDEYAHRFPTKVKSLDKVRLTPPDQGHIDKIIASQSENRQIETKKVIDNSEGQEYIDVERPTPPELSDKEQAVFDTMNTGKKHADEIVTDSGLPARQVLPILTVLELKGHIVRLAGKYFEQRN